MRDFSELDFTTSSLILLQQEHWLGLDIIIEAHNYGEVTVWVHSSDNKLIANKDYHYREWETLGTEGILSYWKKLIEYGDIWFI